jgi:RNA-directed DNA polymerase
MEFLEHRINDKRVLTVIKSWLKAGVTQEGKVLKNDTGAAQGGVISPLLSNIYLHYVLDLWFEKKIKPRSKAKSRLIRYADDFVVGFENENDCNEFRTLLKARLEQFKLKINESKTHVTKLLPPKDSGKGNRRRHISLLGFKIFLQKKRSGKGAKIIYKTNGKKISQSLNSIKERLWKMMHLPIEFQARYLNSVLRGHFNYFGMAGNGRSLAIFRDHVIRIWRRYLSSYVIV